MKKDVFILAVVCILVVLVSSFIGYETGKKEVEDRKNGENEIYYQLGRENFINELNNIMDNEYIHKDGVQIAKKVNECISENYLIFVKNTENGYMITTEYCD